MTIYRKKIKFSQAGIEKAIAMNNSIIAAMNTTLKKAFIKYSLDYLDKKARMYLEQSIGNGKYIPTGKLMSHFQKDYETGRFFNDCFYAAFVEYGTGIVGKGTHPDAGNYQYDINNHGEDGWYYFKDGKLHWTKGLEAHRYMFNAINLYVDSGAKKCFSKAFDEVIGGIINDDK